MEKKDDIDRKIAEEQLQQEMHHAEQELGMPETDLQAEDAPVDSGPEVNKSTVVKTIAWNAIEKYSSAIVSFAVGVVMARLLSPNDYGLIGMTTIFVCIANVFIDSGFMMALVQRKNCTKDDYSTVFYFNIAISIVAFGILYLCAPLIADFYGEEILTPIIRVIGLTFVASSLGSISGTIIYKTLRFKVKAIIVLSTVIFSGIIGIWMALNGWGVWALVYQSVISQVFKSVLMIIVVRWKPALRFSMASLKSLFGFGSRVLGNNILYQIYLNIYPVIIGRYMSPSAVGFYSRAEGYSKLIPGQIDGVISGAMLPILSKIQDDKERLVNFNFKMANVTSFIIFPLMLIMAGLAYPLISVMISDKWLPCAPILQILCVSFLFDHLISLNNNFVLVRGRSDLVFHQQIITTVISIGTLFITLFIGLEAVAVGKGLSSLVTVGWSYRNLRKVLDIDLKKLVYSQLRYVAVAAIIGIVCYLVFLFLHYTLVNLLIVGVVSIGLYLTCSKILFPNILFEIRNIRKLS